MIEQIKKDKNRIFDLRFMSKSQAENLLSNVLKHFLRKKKLTVRVTKVERN